MLVCLAVSVRAGRSRHPDGFSYDRAVYAWRQPEYRTKTWGR